MEILGSQIIPADIQTVWNALNNPEILKNCLPGCESVELTSPDEYKVTITTAIGPLKAKFKGSLKVTQANPPASCVLVFEGQGGAVGFGKGSSQVNLKSVEQGTELSYSAQAHVGGKLAQIGSRLIDSVAKKMSDDFFKAFNQELSPSTSAGNEDQNTQDNSENPVISTPTDLPVNKIDTKDVQSSITQQNMVPAWWLIVAAITGAGIAGLVLKLF